MNNFALKCLPRSTDMHRIDYTFFLLSFFLFPFFPKVIWRGEGRMHCTNLVWTLYINIHVKGIFVSCFLNNQRHLLVICLTCYVDVITSTKGYNNHTLEQLTKKLNKQVYSLQKQCSFRIFLIGTSTDPCFRYGNSQEWQQSSPQSPKPYSLSHALCKTKKIFSQCLTLSCDDVPSN